MHSIRAFLYLLTALVFIQCNKDNEITDPYTECCGNRPVEFIFGNSSVYMPSAFTPNGDGINDIFYPFLNEYVHEIQTLAIYSKDLAVIYITSDMDVQNPAAHGWDGVDADGKKYVGPFTYSIGYLDEEGIVRGFYGSACSILCDSFAVTINSKTDCFFPAQHDGQGGLDANLPTLEEDCF